MGLDVSAYSHLEYVKPWDDDVTDDERDEHVLIENAERCENRMDGERAGLYRETDQTKNHGFSCGSYSGYGDFRKHLCYLGMRTNVRAVWEDETGRYIGKPFYELVNYSDAEGAIGPKTSAKLAADFHQCLTRAESFASKMEPRESAWFMSLYRDWAQAFTLAAGTGFVVLH